jgi:hypothetical protein
MNPIEHVGHWVKEWIIENRPHLNEMGASEEAYQALYKAIRKAWAAISQEKIDALIRGMVERVQALNEVKGWYTKY